MPPSTPPWRLDTVRTAPFSMQYASLCAEPRMAAAAKPAPNSMPLTAPMPKIAALIRFSIPPNSGSPSPGSPMTPHSTIPPTESFSAAAAAISSCIFSPAASSSTGNAREAARKSCSSLRPTGSNGVSATPPTAAICAPIRTPRRARICMHTAPAAQSGAVRRPEKCPPPRASSKPPYFTRAG